MQSCGYRNFFFHLFHFKKQCPYSPRCKVCKEEGHTTGDPAFTEPAANVMPFSGEKIIYQISSHATLPSLITTIYQPNTLTNMWKQWEVVMYREHPPSNRPWSQKYWQLSHQTTSIRYIADLLGDIDHRWLHSRFCRYTESRKKSTDDSTYDNFWAVGLDAIGISHTSTKYWSGKSTLGKILADISSRLRARSPSGRSTSASTTKGNKESGQMDVTQLIQDVKNASFRKTSIKKTPNTE